MIFDFLGTKMLFGLFGDSNQLFLGFRGLIYDFWIICGSILNL